MINELEINHKEHSDTLRYRTGKRNTKGNFGKKE